MESRTVAVVRALLVANRTDSDPGFVGARFRDHGYRFEPVFREDHPIWPALDDVALVVLLGSDWSLYWDHLTEHTEGEAELVRQATASGIPVFGICYGAQMIAHALGGSVRRADEAEVGWYEIESDVPDLIEQGPWLQWHYDVLTVPPTAVELARSPLAPQAFVSGRTMGVQFHPEVDRAIVARWIEGGGRSELERRGLDERALLARTDVESARTGPAAARLVDRYLESVSGAVRD
jgi:GMP synthase-like glutamine amidotransferase